MDIDAARDRDGVGGLCSLRTLSLALLLRFFEIVLGAGAILDEAQIPPQRTVGPPCIKCCVGHTFKPSSRWLRGCLLRVEAYLYLEVERSSLHV